jgi:hypothetical protein
MVAETEKPAADVSARPARRASLRGRSACRCAISSALRLFQPDQAHPVPQPRRTRRAGLGHPLHQPVPRRADRCARRKPDDAGRDHRGRDRRLGDGRDRFHHHRPERLLELQAGESLPPGPPARQPRIPDQSRARRAGAAAADLADPHPRPHLRQRLQSDPRFPPSLFARPDPALRPAAGRGKGAGLLERAEKFVTGLFRRTDLPVYREPPAAPARAFPKLPRRSAAAPRPWCGSASRAS